MQSKSFRAHDLDTIVKITDNDNQNVTNINRFNLDNMINDNDESLANISDGILNMLDISN